MFLEALAKTPFSKEFRFICVDPGPSGKRPALPSYVKAVPTLMIQGEAGPRTNNDVMNWLSERRLTARGTGSAGAQMAGMDDGLAAFGGEMGGIGDEGFAFIGEDTANASGQQVRLTGSMASLDNLHLINTPDTAIRPTANMLAAVGPGGGPAAQSGSGGPGGERQTAKAKAFDDAMAAYMAARERDLAPPPQRR